MKFLEDKGEAICLHKVRKKTGEKSHVTSRGTAAGSELGAASCLNLRELS